MQQRYIWLIVGGALSMVVLACGGIAVAGYFVARDLASAAIDRAQATDGEAHTFELPSPSGSASGAAVVLEDDFADDESGWHTYQDAAATVEYAGGAYRFVLNTEDTSIWETHRAVRLRRLADVTVEVEAQQVDGYADDTFGIVCRAAADDQYYMLEIGADGWYGIGKVDGNEYTLLAGSDMQPSDDPSTTDTQDIALRQGNDIYRLRADCIGDTLTLYADGEKIAEVQDDSFSTGGIGLTAYNYQAPRTGILFDNIVVRTP